MPTRRGRIYYVKRRFPGVGLVYRSLHTRGVRRARSPQDKGRSVRQGSSHRRLSRGSAGLPAQRLRSAGHVARQNPETLCGLYDAFRLWRRGPLIPCRFSVLELIAGLENPPDHRQAQRQKQADRTEQDQRNQNGHPRLPVEWYSAPRHPRHANHFGRKPELNARSVCGSSCWRRTLVGSHVVCGTFLPLFRFCNRV